MIYDSRYIHTINDVYADGWASVLMELCGGDCDRLNMDSNDTWMGMGGRQTARQMRINS